MERASGRGPLLLGPDTSEATPTFSDLHCMRQKLKTQVKVSETSKRMLLSVCLCSHCLTGVIGWWGMGDIYFANNRPGARQSPHLAE